MATHTLEELAGVPDISRQRYDVFISFRGEEMRWNFICHLYHALSDAGICTFKDDMELREGDSIQPELIHAIQSSKISVVIFSTLYADSRWCLDELVEIIGCRKTRGQLVIPVFCNVDPVDILNQQGPFAGAFDSHVRRFNVQRVRMWREALIEAYHLRGLTLNGFGGDEGMLVKHLVRWIEILVKDPKQKGVVDSLDDSSRKQLEASSPWKTGHCYKDSNQGVYICCRGAHIGKKFSSHLHNALVDAGIYVMGSDEELPLGADISHGLLAGTRSCRISVVVFSRGFAESRWCLNELVELMNWNKTTGHLVIPVFYYVDPSDVRGQRGTFGEAFAQHEQTCSPKVVAQWRAALEAAGNLSGHVLNSTFRDEALTIERVVRRISNTINEEIYLPVATFPVGLDSRLLDVNSLISVDSEGVRFIGILGMGGIGKSTLAKAIYNRFLHQFEAKCFLANVRTNSERSDDLVRLQEQLLHDILRFRRHQMRVHNVDEGISIIKKRLLGQKVFIVLDDVSHPEQVRKLVGGRDLFGPGSTIIVTTRYQDVLDNIKVDNTYYTQALNDDESLELFCRNAFGEHSPKEGFMELSKEVIRYTKGVPLALELLGRALNDRSEKEWIDTIQELKIIPQHDLQSKLRISFDALGNDDRVKKLVLDIACYFVGYDRDYAVKILEACGLFPEKGIGVLMKRCLIEVDENNKLKMHDFLRDMGREIAREKSPDDPGKRSHLWHPTDVLSTLRSHSGTREVEGIALELGCDSIERINAEAFAPMKRLKLLKLDHVQIDGIYKHISKELRWLNWHHFSLNFIPDDFYMGELVTIDMQYSKLVELWKDNRFLGNLRVLNLSHSHSLIKTPEFSRLPNLEDLILEDCTGLTEVHSSIRHLQRLGHASFKDCTKLRNLPETICVVKSLQVVNISGCSKIDRLPEGIGQMESLTKLLADGTAIDRVPLSIGLLKNLMDLSLSGCKKPETSSCGSLIWSWVSARPVLRQDNNILIPSLSGLNSLRTLKLMDCGLSDDMIPADIGTLLSLEDLDLRKNRFYSLPESICGLTQLKRLQLDECINLESIPDLPASLFALSANNCVSLNQISASELGPGIRLFLSNCPNLKTVYGLSKHEPDGSVHLEQCSNLTEDFKEFLIKEWCGRGHGEVFLPGTDIQIPQWFDYRNWGSSFSFQLPTYQGTKLKGFTVCVIYASNTENQELRPYPRVYVEPSRFSFSSKTPANITVTTQDHIWAFFLPYSVGDGHTKISGEVKLSAEFGDGWNVKGIGVHIIKDDLQCVSDTTSGLARAKAERKRCFDTVEAGSSSATPRLKSTNNLIL